MPHPNFLAGANEWRREENKRLRLERQYEKAMRDGCPNHYWLGSSQWVCKHTYGIYKLEPSFVLMFSGLSYIPAFAAFLAGFYLIAFVLALPVLIIDTDMIVRKFIPHARNIRALRAYKRMRIDA